VAGGTTAAAAAVVVGASEAGGATVVAATVVVAAATVGVVPATELLEDGLLSEPHEAAANSSVPTSPAVNRRDL
jgi:hypothetical protein